MDGTIKRVALEAGGIFSNNAGGLVFSIKNANGNSAVDQAFSGVLTSMGVPSGTAVKAVKTLVYDLLGLAALEISGGKSEMVQVAGNYAGQFFTGLGTSTLAADPTYVNPKGGITQTPPVATLGPLPSGVLF